MTQTPVGYSTYELDFERLKKDSNKWVESLRTEAWLSFKNLGFPTARKGNEPWKYTNVKTIAETPVILGSHPVPNISLNEISEIAPWSNDWTNIVFVNGRFMDDLSNIDGTEAQVSTLNMAFSENSIDIESALKGINSTNLVNEPELVVPIFKPITFDCFFERSNKVPLPQPLFIEPNQRPQFN